VIKVLWDNCDHKVAFMSAPGQISVQHGKTIYNFEKESSPEQGIENGTNYLKHYLSIGEGSRWQYDPWGGVCIARWRADGELWMGRDNLANDNGTRIWKASSQDAMMLASLHKPAMICWDNKGAKRAWMPDANHISVAHGKTVYSFVRK
jgi:hypothetical protein